MTNNKDKKYKNKIVIATRNKDKENCNENFKECVKKLKELSKSSSVFRSYIICDLDKKKAKEIINEENSKVEIIYNSDPICMTAFNSAIKELNDELKKDKEGNKYHLLTFSKEVELREENIERMIKEIEKQGELKEELIVVGYRLMDNILSEEEYKQFANGDESDNYGIAYQIPWNTCALWNKEFVYGKGKKRLIFDEICEKDKNQLGELRVKVDSKLLPTDYEGMEDGLAIAALVSNNENLKFKLIDEKNKKLDWKIIEEFKGEIGYKKYKVKIAEDCRKMIKHKLKMARKNIVLSTFMNIKGYSIDKLMKAKDVEQTENSFPQKNSSVGWKYLPNNKENKLYYPKDIIELVMKAKNEAKSNEVFYKNPKNKKLIEMQYASAFAIALYSITKDKYYIYPSENPDFHFIEQKNKDKRQIGFSVEIMTLFDYESCSFNQNYEQLADLVWQKKGKTDYDRTELLLISRLNCWFDVDKFIDAMEKYSWKFLCVWLGVYKSEYNWDFFSIIPHQGEKNIKITADLNNIY